MPSNHNKSNFKITETAPYPPGRLSNNTITDPAIEFEWIAIEVFESLRGGKGAVSVILKLDLLWFEGIYLIFGTFDFCVFDVGNEEDCS